MELETPCCKLQEALGFWGFLPESPSDKGQFIKGSMTHFLQGFLQMVFI